MLIWYDHKAAAFEWKIVRNNEIKLQPGQTVWIRRLNDVGVLSGFILYYLDDRKYAVFTSDEIKRKCYKKENFPPDIPLWSKTQLVDWLISSLQEPAHKFRLTSMRPSQ